MMKGIFWWAWATFFSSHGIENPFTPVVGGTYIGRAYNIKNKETGHPTSNYDGDFYTASRAAVKMIRPKMLIDAPFAASYFSGGAKDSAYGWSLPVASSNLVLFDLLKPSITYSYYKPLGLIYGGNGPDDGLNPFYMTYEEYKKALGEN